MQVLEVVGTIILIPVFTAVTLYSIIGRLDPGKRASCTCTNHTMCAHDASPSNVLPAFN